MSTSWTLAIDFGTSFSAAAISDGGTVELVEVEDGRRFPSGVLLGEDGTLLVGRVASNQARRAPERFERTPKRLVGQPAVLLGGQAVEVADLVAAVLRRVGEAAIQRQGGSRPAALVLTCPAEWGPERRAQLVVAARRAGLGEVSLLTEPEAAAWFFVAERRGEEPVVGEGQCVAVYDLGGGTFDTAVLRRRGADFELAGPPGGLDWFGGEAFDERIFELVLSRVYERDAELWRQLEQPTSSAWQRARMQLREDVRDAKEALSTMARVVVPVLGGEEVLDVELTQAEFEDLIRADLERTVSVLEKTVRDAGVAREEIAALYLTGGSSRIPLAAALASEFHASAYTRPDPKTLVAHGATAAPVEAVEAVKTDLTERVGTETQRAEAQQAEATEPAAPVSAPRRSRGRLIAGVTALAVALAAAAVLVLAGGDDGNPGQSEPPAATAAAESEIRQVVEEFSTSSDPAVCDLGTQAFHEKVWGGSGTTAIEACRTQLPRIKRSGRVRIRSLELSDSSASAEVTFGDGEEGEYTLIETQEGWRMHGYVRTKEGSNTGR